MTRKLLTSVMVAVLGGCGVAVGDEGSVASARADFEVVASPTTLTFDAAWNETAAGTIYEGGKVVVDYDAARLPNCRASHNGNPGWQIHAYLRFQPSGAIVEKGLFDYQQTETGPDYHTWVKTLPEFEVPAGTTSIEAWFKNGSGFDHPCTEWDSNYGYNYSFSVQPKPVDALGFMNFQSDWRSTMDGTIARGGKLLVTYAPQRMKTIVDAAKSNGYFASKYHCYGYGCCSFEYATAMHIRFNSWEGYATYPVGDKAIEVAIPSNAGTIELYFDTDVYTTTWFCGGGPEGQKYPQSRPDRFYDSNYGNNFVYTIP